MFLLCCSYPCCQLFLILLCTGLWSCLTEGCDHSWLEFGTLGRLPLFHEVGQTYKAAPPNNMDPPIQPLLKDSSLYTDSLGFHIWERA